ncbi:uncharacterized protein LOC119034356 isoform X2 [Acanthopagrus latus]|uniref:uncharacterized protein LOC119034356 isoform X2 n=1 Tax=Acanthopagrus latus TaxID=8177 RepID=UPI00187D0A97|nr:uncharacterized protein LOC119034356 isoform X2 [Acanthopagrus latus]
MVETGSFTGHNQAANGYNNPSDPNTCTSKVEQLSEKEIPQQDLAELLGVTPDVNPSEGPETDSAQQKLRDVRLIQASVSQHLPKPPSDLDQNLQQHLVNVQDTVRSELMRLSPRLEKMGLTGSLIDCYHHQTLDHICDLFKKVQSSQKMFELMNWVLHPYLSQDLLVHPDHQENAPIKKGDFPLPTELVAKAEKLLLENVQKEVRKCLDQILLIHTNQDDDSEESCIGLYVDIIQLVNVMPEEAQEINSKLSHDIREVCFQELKMFLGRYTAEQTKILGEKAKKAIPNQIHFLKILKTCKEIKKHVQTKSEGIEDSLIQEIVAALENMEDFTLKLLMEIVADMTELCFCTISVPQSRLQNYFTTKYKRFFLISDVETHFAKVSWCPDIQKRVMDEAYKLIAHTYLKHLVRSSQRKLRKCWSPDVVQKVIEDAELLHNTISKLAPGVEQWKLPELLEDENIDAVKITVATMQRSRYREDEELLSTLLVWKGLSKSQAKQVLGALPEHEPRQTNSVSECRHF